MNIGYFAMKEGVECVLILNWKMRIGMQQIVGVAIIIKVK